MRKIDLSNDLLNRERIGSILKTSREENELSQRDVARKIGYANTNFISMIETGRSSPPLGKLSQLCEAVGAEPILVPIILKYLYSDAWMTVVSAIRNCDKDVFNDGEKIDEKVEASFIEYIKNYSMV